MDSADTAPSTSTQTAAAASPTFAVPPYPLAHGGGALRLVGGAATAAAGSTVTSVAFAARCIAGVPLVKRLRRRLWKRQEDGDPGLVIAVECCAEMSVLFLVLRWTPAAGAVAVLFPPGPLRRVAAQIARKYITKPNVQNRLRDLGMKGARNWLLKQADEAALEADEAWNTLQENLPQSVLQQVTEVEAAAYAMVRNAAQGLTDLAGMVSISAAMGGTDGVVGPLDAVRRTSATFIVNVNEVMPRMYDALMSWGRAGPPAMLDGPPSSSSSVEGDATPLGQQQKEQRVAAYEGCPPKRVVELLTQRGVPVRERQAMLEYFIERYLADVNDHALMNEIALERFLVQSGGVMEPASAAIRASYAWRGRRKFLSKEDVDKREWNKYVYAISGNDRMGRAAIVVKIGMACSNLPSGMLPEALTALISVIEMHWLQTCSVSKPKRPRGQLSAIVDVEGATPLNTPVDLFIEGIVSLSQNYPGLGGDFHFVNVPTSLQPVAQLLSSLVMAGPRASRVHYHDLYSFGKSELNRYFTLHQLPTAYGGKARYRVQGDETLAEELARREGRIRERRERIKRWRRRLVYVVVMPVTAMAQMIRLLFAPLLASLVFASQVASKVLQSAVLVERVAVPLLVAFYVVGLVYLMDLYTDGSVSPVVFVSGFARDRARMFALQAYLPKLIRPH